MTELHSGRQIFDYALPNKAPGNTAAMAGPLSVSATSGTQDSSLVTDDVDLEDWILMYERVSGHNCWDPTLRWPANLFIFLL